MRERRQCDDAGREARGRHGRGVGSSERRQTPRAGEPRLCARHGRRVGEVLLQLCCSSVRARGGEARLRRRTDGAVERARPSG
eukprot:2280880-Prymnesium_polylepis.2